MSRDLFVNEQLLQNKMIKRTFHSRLLNIEKYNLFSTGKIESLRKLPYYYFLSSEQSFFSQKTFFKYAGKYKQAKPAVTSNESYSQDCNFSMQIKDCLEEGSRSSQDYLW